MIQINFLDNCGGELSPISSSLDGAIHGLNSDQQKKINETINHEENPAKIVIVPRKSIKRQLTPEDILSLQDKVNLPSGLFVNLTGKKPDLKEKVATTFCKKLKTSEKPQNTVQNSPSNTMKVPDNKWAEILEWAKNVKWAENVLNEGSTGFEEEETLEQGSIAPNMKEVTIDLD